jgi:RHS repeat-associated protein
MPSLKFSNTNYRYGFNGKEKDDEGLGGSGTTYDYGFRIYNANIAKFLSVDPLTKSYPWYTPYQFAGNKPIVFIDRDGLEEARLDEWFWSALSMYDANMVRINSNRAVTLATASGLPNPGDGKFDAFRHTIWNAMNARDVGADDAEPFATRHETGSDANDPMSVEYDPIAIQMDLHNNAIGRRIGAANPSSTDQELVNLVNQALANGELWEIKFKDFNVQVTDANGNAVTQQISLPVSIKGNPITIDPNVTQLLQTSGYTVEGNPAKVIQKSSNPTITPNGTKTPPLGDGYGGKTTTTAPAKQPTSKSNNITLPSDETKVAAPILKK